jgi:hypothetical protein
MLTEVADITVILLETVNYKNLYQLFRPLQCSVEWDVKMVSMQ